MAAASDDQVSAEEKPKRSKGGLIVGLVLALVMGGGGFFVGSTGLISIGSKDSAQMDDPEKMADPMENTKVAFVEIEPILIALARESERRHLRFRGHLEVEGKYSDEVTELMPRILDVLNSYLRAIELRQLEDPSGLLRLRTQMLRRVQIVSGEGRVRDLLISEFVVRRGKARFPGGCKSRPTFVALVGSNLSGSRR